MKKIVVWILVLSVALISCGCNTSENTNLSPNNSSDSIESSSIISQSSIETEEKDYLSMREELIKPYTHDTGCNCKISTTKIMEGTNFETEITLISTDKEGKTVFVVGGVHGDEIAGYKAADIIKENICPKTGNVYVVSPANAYGAKNNSRYVGLGGDLNRSFPGMPQGEPESVLAYEIFSLIDNIKPDFVIDMHEAYIKQSSRDFLGSSIIFTTSDGMEDLLMEFLLDSEAGKVCTEPFNFYTGAPKGSINQSISTDLKIPVITIETFRDYPLDRRIYDHLDIFLYWCKYSKVL